MKARKDLSLVFWIIGTICTIGILTNNIADDDLVLTDDAVSTIDRADLRGEEIADDHAGLEARKRAYRTYAKTSTLDKPVFGDFESLVQSPSRLAGKFETRTSLSEKRAYMHDPFTSMSEQLETNAKTLNTLTGDISMLKSECSEKMDDLKAILDWQKANAGMMDTLSRNVTIMKSEFMTVKSQLKTTIDEFKTIVDILKTNEDRSADRISDHLMAISEIVKANSRKIDNLHNYIGGQPLYSSCLAYLKVGYTISGEYSITIPHTKIVFTVYCDQETDGGGWLVFQRRRDGTEDFSRNWKDYKNGFGKISGEFWLGNDYLNLLTKEEQELRIDLMDFDGNTAYAKYTTFTVGTESEKYRLLVTGYSGTAGDSLGYHNETDFSTTYEYHPAHTFACPLSIAGGWWYKYCFKSHLNGRYYHSAKSNPISVFWYHWKEHKSLKKSEMKIRPKT